MPILIGVALGAAVCLFAATVGFSKDRSFYPTVLIVVASYYVLFAIGDGGAGIILAELAIAMVFIVLAVLGFKRSPWLVALGLFAHGVQDGFHLLVVANRGVPPWWPAFCGSIDVCLAVILAWMIARRKVSPNVQDSAVLQS